MEYIQYIYCWWIYIYIYIYIYISDLELSQEEKHELTSIWEINTAYLVKMNVEEPPSTPSTITWLPLIKEDAPTSSSPTFWTAVERSSTPLPILWLHMNQGLVVLILQLTSTPTNSLSLDTSLNISSHSWALETIQEMDHEEDNDDYEK